MHDIYFLDNFLIEADEVRAVNHTHKAKKKNFLFPQSPII